MTNRDAEFVLSWALVLALLTALVWFGAHHPRYQPPASTAEAEALEDLLYLAPILFQ